jgi:hypothetical protein
MRRTWLWAAAALALAACGDGRRAGTEVGNPELTVTVTAQVGVLDAYDSVVFSALHVRMMGMEYVLSGNGRADTGRCWKRPGGILLNLAAPDSMFLADTAVEDGSWLRTEVVLRAPEDSALLPGSADIRTWDNPRYIKFQYISPSRSDTVPALFEWPRGTEIRLLYGPETIEAWRVETTLWIPFLFWGYAWADALDGTAPATWTQRRDGRGAPYLVFSPGENAATWKALKDRLPECFLADSVIIR